MKNAKVLSLIVFVLIFYADLYAQNKDFPYKLSKSEDITLLSTAFSASMLYVYLDNNYSINYLKPEEVLSLSRKDINSVDRCATYNWSPKSDNASDYFRDVLKYAPALLIIPQIKNKQWNNILVLGVMYIEGYLINSSFTSNTKIVVQRLRPYMYNDELSIDQRIALSQEETSYKSFYSGHTSSAFYNAVFISKVLTDIYGKSGYTYAVWGLTLSAAATTAYLRYEAGKHYPTDIIVGAVSASAIGYLIPYLHKKTNKNIALIVKPDNQIGLKFTF